MEFAVLVSLNSTSLILLYNFFPFPLMTLMFNCLFGAEDDSDCVPHHASHTLNNLAARVHYDVQRSPKRLVAIWNEEIIDQVDRLEVLLDLSEGDKKM